MGREPPGSTSIHKPDSCPEDSLPGQVLLVLPASAVRASEPPAWFNACWLEPRLRRPRLAFPLHKGHWTAPFTRLLGYRRHLPPQLLCRQLPPRVQAHTRTPSRARHRPLEAALRLSGSGHWEDNGPGRNEGISSNRANGSTGRARRRKSGFSAWMSRPRCGRTHGRSGFSSQPPSLEMKTIRTQMSPDGRTPGRWFLPVLKSQTLLKT